MEMVVMGMGMVTKGKGPVESSINARVWWIAEWMQWRLWWPP